MSAVLIFVRLVRMRHSANASLPRSIVWAAAPLKQNCASARRQRALKQSTTQKGNVA